MLKLLQTDTFGVVQIVSDEAHDAEDDAWDTILTTLRGHMEYVQMPDVILDAGMIGYNARFTTSPCEGIEVGYYFAGFVLEYHPPLENGTALVATLYTADNPSEFMRILWNRYEVEYDVGRGIAREIATGILSRCGVPANVIREIFVLNTLYPEEE